MAQKFVDGNSALSFEYLGLSYLNMGMLRVSLLTINHFNIAGIQAFLVFNSNFQGVDIVSSLCQIFGYSFSSTLRVFL